MFGLYNQTIICIITYKTKTVLKMENCEAWFSKVSILKCHFMKRQSIWKASHSLTSRDLALGPAYAQSCRDIWQWNATGRFPSVTSVKSVVLCFLWSFMVSNFITLTWFWIAFLKYRYLFFKSFFLTSLVYKWGN